LESPGAGSQPVASFVFIPATSTVTLISPTHNAQGVTNSPDLKVSLSNAAPGGLTVKF